LIVAAGFGSDAYCSGSNVIRKFLSNKAGLSGSGNGDAL
jgi:hypothetical protein